jgi:biotin transport system substrate-specific component
MTFIGVMAALTCIIGPIAIPLPVTAVPISFTNLVIYFSVYLLGMKFGTLSYVVYLLLGLVGLPVFSNYTGGLTKLAGPTGGYLIGFIFLALVCGFFADKFKGNRWFYTIGMIVGLVIAYVFGTLWLAFQGNLTFAQALFAGVIPFLPGDAAKIVVCVAVAPAAKRLLDRALGAARR